MVAPCAEEDAVALAQLLVELRDVQPLSPFFGAAPKIDTPNALTKYDAPPPAFCSISLPLQLFSLSVSAYRGYQL